jgi:hypothetical protein
MNHYAGFIQFVNKKNKVYNQSANNYKYSLFKLNLKKIYKVSLTKNSFTKFRNLKYSFVK